MAFNWDSIDTDVNPALVLLPEFNSGAFDISLNPHGFAGGGHISQFPLSLAQVAIVAQAFPAFADLMSGYADAAAASAVLAGNNVTNLTGSSTTSQSLSSGSKSLTTQSGKSWGVGTTLMLSSDANPTTHWMVIQVTSYATTALQGDVKLFSGSGSRSDWTIRLVGYPGRAAGFAYLWSTGVTASDPTSGFVKINNATPGSATAMYISETDFDGNSLGTYLATLDDGTSTAKARVLIQSVTQSANFIVVDITGTLTDNGTWDTFAISPVASGGTLVNGAMVSITPVITGNKGDTGATGPSYAATSVTSLAIGTGSKSFTTQSGLAYQVGARLRATDAANSANWMEGLVTSYATTTLQITSDLTSGSGTIANWLINIAGERGATGATGPTGDDGGFEYQFNSGTSGDPGTGKFLFNNATFASASSFFINETDGNANSLSSLLAAIDDGAGTNKTLVFAIKQGGAAHFSFYITAALVDVGSYDTFSITPISTAGSITNNDTFHLLFIPLEKGAAGTTGAAGPTTAPTWVFDTGTADADPGTNKFALNNATIGSVTKAFINDTGLGSADMTAFVLAWDDSTNSTHRGDLFIVQATDPTKWGIFTTGTVSDDGSYLDVGLTYVAGPGGFTAAATCAFAFTRAGNAGAGSGDVVGPASATDTALARYDGGTGKLLQNSVVTLSATVLAPAVDDAVALGSTTKEWADLFLASGAVINYANGNAAITHSSGILTVTVGDFRITTAGSNSASAVTVGGTQTLTNKTLTSPAITTPTGIVKGDVGLGNADNTSDANKPISTAQLGHNSIVGAFRVRAATTANIAVSTALNNADALDGVTLATGDLVLVKDQSSASGNGIYVVAASPARHTLLAAFNDYPGITVIVTEGTVNADSHWECTSDAGGTIDSNSLTFARYGGTFPTTTTDNTVPRFDGTSAAIQTSGVTIDDSNNVTGVGSLAASGLVSTPASATGGAGLRVAHGVAPTSPTNGDFWSTTIAWFVRTNGVTQTLATLEGTQTFSGTITLPATINFSSQGSIVKSGNHALTLTTTGTTNVTFPLGTSTLATNAAASTTLAGLVELATDAETQTGTDTVRGITPSNLTAKEATTAQYLANTADFILTTDQANAAGALFGLTDGATINWDMASGFNASVTLGGNRTLANPTNTIVGRTGAIVVTQDGTGGRTLAYGTNWEAAGAVMPVLSTAIGAKDVIFYWIQSSTSIIITGILKAVA